MIKHYFKYIFSVEYRMKCIIEANRADLEKTTAIPKVLKKNRSSEHDKNLQLERSTLRMTPRPVNKNDELTTSLHSNIVMSTSAASDNSCSPSFHSDSTDSSCSSSSGD